MEDWKFLSTADFRFYGDNNDISFDSVLHDIVPIQGTPRIKQDVSKDLLTESGADISDLDYGSGLYTFLFQSAYDSQVRKNMADNVTKSLNHLIDIEQSNEQSETITELRSIRLDTPQDQRFINLNILLIMADGTPLEITLANILGA